MPDLKPIEWRKGSLIILDQTCLPASELYIELHDYQEVAQAIQRLAVRGAPAIGLAAAYGVVVGARGIKTKSVETFRTGLKKVFETLAASRPTARNLFWALEQMKKVADNGSSVAEIKKALERESTLIHREQVESDRALSLQGAGLINEGDAVLTHCNAGALATGGYGTALGVIKQAYRQGKIKHVFATETRPLLQGARLTASELKQACIPFTLITDSMAGSFMRLGRIQAVVTGADRIAANGDTANKIGTYSLAVLARAHRIPFYIAAPYSTVDFSISSGKQIVIEERLPDEVCYLQGVRIAPDEIIAANPAFDVTPQRYISAFITEKGIIQKPFRQGLRQALQGGKS